MLVVYLVSHSISLCKSLKDSILAILILRMGKQNRKAEAKPVKAKSGAKTVAAKEDQKAAASDAEHASLVLVARGAMGLVALFGVLTSGAVDFLFELRVKADDSAPASAWAPETLAADIIFVAPNR